MKVLKIHRRRLIIVLGALCGAIVLASLRFVIHWSRGASNMSYRGLSGAGETFDGAQLLELQLETGKWRPRDMVDAPALLDNFGAHYDKTGAAAAVVGAPPAVVTPRQVDTLISPPSCVVRVPLGVIFTKANNNSHMQLSLAHMLSTMAAQSRDTCVLVHVFVDEASTATARTIFSTATASARLKYQLQLHNITAMAEKSRELIVTLQRHFAPRPGSYYNDVLFFLTVGMHRSLAHVRRLIMMDVDVSVRGDITSLYHTFDRFSPTQVMGLSRELSPVYRHVLRKYRQQHADTRAGSPPPAGQPGLNSGVVLLDLSKMRESRLYNELLRRGDIDARADRYSFKGHLGDQDFYTLLSLDHPQLFHEVSCAWNRQLCTFWNNSLYWSHFDKYFACEQRPVMLYHGNCRTKLPALPITPQPAEHVLAT